MVPLTRLLLGLHRGPEDDTGRYAVGAELALQPTRIAQLVDPDIDRAVGVFGYCPRGQVNTGLNGGRAAWQ